MVLRQTILPGEVWPETTATRLGVGHIAGTGRRARAETE